jgi:protein involved in polysaccharide export with SLBB domain
MPRVRLHTAAIRRLAILCTILSPACAPTDTMRIGAGATAPASISTTSTDSEGAIEQAKLDNLWTQRQITALRNEDYPIGPGDVLTVSVPDVEQLTQRRVRVSPRGDIELPMLGTVQAAGLSEEGVAAEIKDKLKRYMYEPEADVFVEEYRNRVAAVVGAVNHPGLIPLANPSESLVDVITQAGGLSGAAADEMILIPARPGRTLVPPAGASSVAQFGNSLSVGQAASLESLDPGLPSAPGEASHSDGYSLKKAADTAQIDAAVESSATSNWLPSSAAAPKAGLGDALLSNRDGAPLSAGVARQARDAVGPVMQTNHSGTLGEETAPNLHQALQLAGSNDAITLKLKDATLAGLGKYFNLPMRPGDVLIVPGGGDVMVVGWVHQPGRFQVGSGLTVLGAIGAAGGPMYAAKTKNIVLIRSGEHGVKVTIPINLDSIASRQAVDPPVQANDVIDVPYSELRIGPYIFYSILTRVGIAGPVIPY